MSTKDLGETESTFPEITITPAFAGKEVNRVGLMRLVALRGGGLPIAAPSTRLLELNTTESSFQTTLIQITQNVFFFLVPDMHRVVLT